MEQVKIMLEGGMMPSKGSVLSAAYDVYSPCDYVLRRGRQVVGLGFRMELPHEHEAIVQTRSGFASKGMEVTLVPRRWVRWLLSSVPNARIDAEVVIGVVDEDYRGEVGAIVCNRRFWLSSLLYDAVIPRGTRLAQMRVRQVPPTVIVEAEELDMSNDRGGGFGHTGAK